MEREHPLAVEAALGGFLGSHCDARSGQAGELEAVFNNDAEGVGGVEKIFVEREEEARKLGVYSREFCFLLVGEQSAVAHKSLVVRLYGALAVGAEVEAVAAVIEIFYAVEELGVHHHLVGELRVSGVERLGDFGHFGSVVALIEREEYCSHFVEDFARLLQREDSVVEGRSLGIGCDRVYLSLFLGYTGFKGRQIVVVADLVKRRNCVRCCVRLHKGVGLGLFFAGNEAACTCERGRCGK